MRKTPFASFSLMQRSLFESVINAKINASYFAKHINLSYVLTVLTVAK